MVTAKPAAEPTAKPNFFSAGAGGLAKSMVAKPSNSAAYRSTAVRDQKYRIEYNTMEYRVLFQATKSIVRVLFVFLNQQVG